MKINKLILPLLLIASLFTIQSDNLAQAQTTSPTSDGRPPDVFASPASSGMETCSCTSSDGNTPWTCTIYTPPETRPCHDVCIIEANGQASMPASTEPTP